MFVKVLLLFSTVYLSEMLACRRTVPTISYHSVPRTRWRVGKYTKNVQESYDSNETYTSYKSICCIGFELIQDECKPICSPPCINGNCVTPGKCLCRPGFRSEGSKDNCVPYGYCKSTCKNGICTASYECSCNDGYIKEGGECVPGLNSQDLTSEDSTSFTADLYDLSRKSTMKRSTNQAIVEELTTESSAEFTGVIITESRIEDFTNSIVVTTAESIEDFTSANMAVSTADTIDNSIGESTTDIIAELTVDSIETPESTTLSIIDWTENISDVGVPICEPTCFNAECVAPNVCRSWQGYKHMNDNKRHNELVCPPGYMLSQVVKSSTTEFVAESSIDTGTEFTADTFIEATTAYTADTSTEATTESTAATSTDTTTEYTADSTEYTTQSIRSLNPQAFECIPVCNPPCQNGICASPDVCECFEGYENDAQIENRCNLICNETCVNSNENNLVLEKVLRGINIRNIVGAIILFLLIAGVILLVIIYYNRKISYIVREPNKYDEVYFCRNYNDETSV